MKVPALRFRFLSNRILDNLLIILWPSLDLSSGQHRAYAQDSCEHCHIWSPSFIPLTVIQDR